jgi:hypothetical protein
MKRTFLTAFMLIGLWWAIGLAATGIIADNSTNAAQSHFYWGAAEKNIPQISPTIPPIEPKPQPSTILQGGDNIENAFVITSLPFEDAGTTVGYNNDFELSSCGGFGGPDVVYAFTPNRNMYVNIHMCGSQFYTVLFVYVNDTTNLLLCNSYYDFCMPSGGVDNLLMESGNTYYMVVDGYYTSQGNYNFEIYETPVLNPPAGSIPEGEPDCGEGYVDNYNGGCNSDVPVFQPITIGQTIYGSSGTWHTESGNYRDTDWYILSLTQPKTIKWTVVAEFAMQCFIFAAGDCQSISPMSNGRAVSGDTITIEANASPGDYYLFVSPYFFSGFPCPSNYIATLTAEDPPLPPPNDNCVDVTPQTLIPGTPLVFTGDNTGATVDCPDLGSVPEAWVAFTLETTMDITLTQCGSMPVRTQNYVVMYNTCPCDGNEIYFSSYDNWHCGDGNITITFNGLEAGTYYYPIITIPGAAMGPYIITVSSTGYPEIEYSPESISGSAQTGNQFIDTLTIANVGYAALEYDIRVTQNPAPRGLIGQGGDHRLTPENTYLGSAKPETKNKEVGAPAPQRKREPGMILQGGEDISSAVIISSLPYYDNGNTSSAFNDYSSSCGGSTAPDVVYAYTPADDIVITAATLISDYDTELYIFENDEYNEVACNDDYRSGVLGSFLPEIQLYAGNTYYIVVDGAGTTGGNYRLEFFEYQPCTIECPPGGLTEAEACGDNFNGGCTVTPNEYEPYTIGTTVCGTAWATPQTRDTDWYILSVTQPSYLTCEAKAEFPLQFGIIDAASGCVNPTILDVALADPCSTALLQVSVMPGDYWIFVAPSLWTDISCDNSGVYPTRYYFSVNREPGWLLADVRSGSIVPGSPPVDVTITLDASQIPAGTYNGRIDVLSNDPNTPSINIPVSFAVTGGCSYLIGDINSDGQRMGGDVTYGVRYFKGTGPAPRDSCYMDSTGAYLYVTGDVNGNCEFRGSDITRLVAYFKGTAQLSYCHFFPPPVLRNDKAISPKLSGDN